MSGYNRNRRRGRRTRRRNGVAAIGIRALVIAVAGMLVAGAGVAVYLGIQNHRPDEQQIAKNPESTQPPDSESQGGSEVKEPLPTATPEPEPETLYEMGKKYFEGDGVGQDYEQAYICCRQAAEKSYVPAMVYLGYMYYHGMGIGQDHEQAAAWYEESAKQGDAYSMNELGYMYQTGRGVDRDYGKALEWYEKAAEQGSAAAAMNLGYLYENGLGTDKNAGKASEWYAKGGELGSGASGIALEATVGKDNFKVVDWGLGSYSEGKKPVGMASIEEMAKYSAFYCTDNYEKVLYLTFDCGYENGYTEPILDVLKKHNVSATFFVVGHYLNSAPDIVKRMVAEGHSVGNHSYHHPDMASISEWDAFKKELDDVSNQFKEITGVDLWPYYRPPQGKYCVDNLKMAQEMGYHTFFWSIAHADWDPDSQPSHEKAMKTLEDRTHPGAIVLLHAVSKTNTEILDELLTKWENEGYIFRTLDDFVE